MYENVEVHEPLTVHGIAIASLYMTQRQSVNKRVKFLHVIFSFGYFLPTTAGLTGSVNVPSFKQFHPPSDTVFTHADLQVLTTRLFIHH
jgi:hypothetical protein